MTDCMEYRKLPHGDEMISVLGIGTSSLGESSEEEIIRTIHKALNAGINYIDLASGHAKTFEALGKALEGKRDQVYLQIHFGADYRSGEYGWTTDLNTIRKSVAWQLEKLKTDRIDFGFIHCIDELSDLHKIQKNGVLDEILRLKKEGIIRHIGVSTHSPKLAEALLDLGILDVMMFSINPAYDNAHGDYTIGENDERMNMYRR